ncbi:MAG: hypothetical protein KGZ25_01260, partial [Planctomycetes bacterium]|nr:hypothetical protein [Planctomycetota bacterium]
GRSAFSTETISFRSDKRLMRAIAEKTGGLSVEAGNFDSLVESIEPRKQFEVRVHEYSLWHSVWMLLVMVGLVTGEYILRRKAGKVL